MQFRREEELSAEDRALVDDERAWLERARQAIAAERSRSAQAGSPDGHRSIDALRRLRDDALTASIDDLPDVLHEMSVRQALIQRAAQALPDEAAPYFAHLKVDEGGTEKDYLLGPTSLVDTRGGVRIVDWRVAPVARVFYQYREGDEYEEEFPGRTAEGTVVSRRVVVIEGGELLRVIAGDAHLYRDTSGQWHRLGAEASALDGGGAGTAARPALGTGAGSAALPSNVDVTALLDTDQFAAVSAPLKTPLVVLGSAGSGKTTVALHRLARVPDGGGHVVVPEEGLARLWQRLLSPFVRDVAARHPVETLDAWALRLSRAVFGPRLPKVTTETPGLVASLKRHPALFDALARQLGTVRPEYRRLRKRLATLLSDWAFLGEVVASANRYLPKPAIEATVRHTMHQLGDSFERELAAVVVKERKQAIDGRRITDGTPAELAGTLDAEDLPLLLWAYAHAGGSLPENTAHLVLDEAEDFAAFELDVMGRMLGTPRGVTLAGDEAQQTSSCFAGWPSSLARLGAPEAAAVRLAVSYRCPDPVTEFARGVLGRLAPEERARSVRGGAPVGRFAFPAEAQADLFVVSSVTALVDREPRASVAVIAESAETAERLFALLSQHPAARLVLHGEFGFEPGIDVTHVDVVKGLEFDYVVVPDATGAAYPNTDDARRRLHVAATRTSHQLWVVSSGAPSPILPI